MSWNAHRYTGRIVRHHMTNRCKGGSDEINNLLRMKRSREVLLHKHFQNLTWEEIGEVLKQIFGVSEPKKVIAVIERVSRMKGRKYRKVA